jgi:hypothetical protein
MPIDPSVPSSPTAYTADIRENWLAIIERFEALEALPRLVLQDGMLQGGVIIAPSTFQQPAIGLGAATTGLYGRADAVGITVGGVAQWQFGATTTWCRGGNLEMNGGLITSIGDAAGASDALNRQTADKRYASIDLQQQMEFLRADMAELKRLLLAPKPNYGEVGRAMPTTLYPGATAP